MARAPDDFDSGMPSSGGSADSSREEQRLAEIRDILSRLPDDVYAKFAQGGAAGGWQGTGGQAGGGAPSGFQAKPLAPQQGSGWQRDPETGEAYQDRNDLPWYDPRSRLGKLSGRAGGAINDIYEMSSSMAEVWNSLQGEQVEKQPSRIEQYEQDLDDYLNVKDWEDYEKAEAKWREEENDAKAAELLRFSPEIEANPDDYQHPGSPYGMQQPWEDDGTSPIPLAELPEAPAAAVSPAAQPYALAPQPPGPLAAPTSPLRPAALAPEPPELEPPLPLAEEVELDIDALDLASPEDVPTRAAAPAPPELPGLEGLIPEQEEELTPYEQEIDLGGDKEPLDPGWNVQPGWEEGPPGSKKPSFTPEEPPWLKAWESLQQPQAASQDEDLLDLDAESEALEGTWKQRRGIPEDWHAPQQDEGVDFDFSQESPTAAVGGGGGEDVLPEMLATLKSIDQKLDRQEGYGQSGSGALHHPLSSGSSSLDIPDIEADEGFPASSPSVSVSTVPTLGAGGFSHGSRRPAPQSLTSGGTPGKPKPGTGRSSFLEPKG